MCVCDVCKCVCVCVMCMCVCMHVCACVCVHICECVRMCVYVCMYVHVYVYVSVSRCACVYDVFFLHVLEIKGKGQWEKNPRGQTMVELQGSPASKSFLSGKGLGLEVRVPPRAPGVVEPKPHGHEFDSLRQKATEKTGISA